MCECGGMRKGVEVRLGSGDRDRLEGVIGSRNSPQKHVWRARIVLLSADGVGTMTILDEPRPPIARHLRRVRWRPRSETQPQRGGSRAGPRLAGKGRQARAPRLGRAASLPRSTWLLLSNMRLKLKVIVAVRSTATKKEPTGPIEVLPASAPPPPPRLAA
jgi:hypothetical protein